ncbi:hypothetical protein Tco_1442906, partial [Tanacetum coccineum]
MNPLIVQQCALDDALVTPDNHAIIGKCLSGKVTAFYQLRLSRAQILWGMYYKKNVDFVELIWEDFMYQIDNRQSTSARRSNMPYPRFTKAIIQHFISKDKTISMRNNLFMHGVNNDSVLGFMKFVSKYEIRQVYGKLIPDVLVSKEMLESKAYKTYLDYAIGKVIPKEARKRIKAHMKETSLTSDDNIIPDDPDAALELAKSINKIEAEEQEAARLVHETHERGSSEGAGSKLEVLNESKGKTKDTNEGVGAKPEVPDVSKAMSSDQESKNESWGESEDGDGDDRKSDDERTKSGDDKSIDLNKTDDEEEAQEDKFELYGDMNVEMKDVEPADKDKGDEEMTDAEKADVEHEEIHQEVASAKVQDKLQATTITAPATQKEKTVASPSSSSRSVSSNSGSIFLNLDNIYSVETEIISMLDFQVQQEIPKFQSSSLLTVPVSVIPEPTLFSSIPEIVTTAPVTTTPPPIPPFIPHSQQSTPIPTPTTTKATTSTPAVLESETLSAIHLRASDLENDVKELKNVNHSTTLLATIKSKVLTAIKMYLGTSLDDALHKVLQRHTAEFIMEHSVLVDVVEVLKQQQK